MTAKTRARGYPVAILRKKLEAFEEIVAEKAMAGALDPQDAENVRLCYRLRKNALYAYLGLPEPEDV